jgi:hypothetical protein
MAYPIRRGDFSQMLFELVSHMGGEQKLMLPKRRFGKAEQKFWNSVRLKMCDILLANIGPKITRCIWQYVRCLH